jgi:acetylornithine aminotransferase
MSPEITATDDLATPHLMNTFARLPAAMDHGQGCYVWDTQGRRYLDAIAGIAVNTLGHNHARFVAAVQQQVAKIIHCCNYYYAPDAEKLAAKLVAASGLTNAFFCNSGLEANEAAIKLARKFGHDKGVSHPKIVVYEHAFHGRSLATLSATGNPALQRGFEPMVEGFIRVPANDLDALKAATAGQSDVVAVFLETIQGEGGIHPMRWDYLRAVQKLCHEHNWLLILDEVQCGMGRTGKWFAYQWADIAPDAVTMAKGLASGVPIGALLAGPRAAKVFTPGSHGSTFGGNPLAMRAGLETVCIVEDDGLLHNAKHVGDHLKAALTKALIGTPGVKEVRGEGLMLGIELDRPCGALAQHALQAGLLISVTANTVVRLLPPLIVTTSEADEIVERLVPVIKIFLQT